MADCSSLRYHLLVIMLPLLTLAQPNQNISLGSSLNPIGPKTSWVSPSRDFAFGFLPLSSNSSLFLLGIWFNNIPDKNVVWWAKSDIPLQLGSKLELTSNGRLVLSNHAGNEVWTANANGDKVTHAMMLDTGNFVLANAGSGDFMWESFKNPTDTILPTQALGLNYNLTSRLMETDYSDGRFQLSVRENGAVLYTIAAPTGLRYGSYWEFIVEGINTSQLVFDKSGNVYMALNNGSSRNITSGSVSTTQFYQRATLDPDGVFREYVFPRNGTRDGSWVEGRWSIIQHVPAGICNLLNDMTGRGICGYNAYCSEENQKTVCNCPTEYKFLDPERKYKGCIPDFVIPSCGRGYLTEVYQYEMVEMTNVNWPFGDYEHFRPINEDTCRRYCMDDCFCAAAVYWEDNCWKKRLPLTNGRMDPSVNGGKVLLKVSKTNRSTIDGPNPNQNQIQTKARVKMLKRRHQPDTRMMESRLQYFTYKELEEATNGFKEELGRGASGIVYKGELSSASKVLIAVKKLDRIEKGAEREFVNEVRAVGHTHHKNLVRLFGFCNEGPHKLLIYEFMSNGSLTNFLFESAKQLRWNQRTQIALGISKGLQYLHDECNNQIIHCDIKPQNVLLDDSFVAKISDFGLAKLLMTEQTRTSTGIRGTRGYVAPEWFKRMPITAKVDVYSFGVMLLEIICCRKNVELEFGDDAKTILTDWAYDCYKEKKLDLLVDHNEEAILNMGQLERFVMVAPCCIQEEPVRRPSMKKVLQMLEGEIDVFDPPSYSFNQ